jgi:3-deoxy-D-manno-octulosonic acid kinase
VTLLESRTTQGGILYDPTRVPRVDPDLFDPASWLARGAWTGSVSGRGAVLYLARDGGDWVLRRYRRGGFIGRWIEDSFIYFGAERTRSFREVRLLALLHGRGLPVPRPVAAHFSRSGLRYTADLITERMAADKLSSWLARAPVPERVWGEVGRMLARFHAAGVWHADLTAHNILLDGAGQPYLLDFDRGRIRRPGRWRQRNLARLLRSLHKIRPQVKEATYPEPQWQWLLAGYAAAATE